MTIYDILSRLQNVEGPDAGGNYKACCPAHADKKQSLSVKAGDKGIILKCFAGCGTREICDRLGIQMKDLFPDKPKEAPAPKQQRKIVKTYPYTDEQGRLLFEVVRYEPKGFSQRMPDPDHPGKYIWKSCPVQVLYRLPAIKEAIDQNTWVCVAEGEKDADTLTRLGYCGTTIAMGAGKWRPSHVEQLQGAKVVLFCDNDEPGRAHVKEGIEQLKKVTKEVRVVDLKTVWEEMPDKADVSDLVQTFGDEKAKELIKEAFGKGWWTAEANPQAKSPAQIRALADDTEAGRLYSKVGGYSVLDGHVVTFGSDGGVKQLATFAAIPRKVITRDDGVNTDTAYEIDGWAADGRELGKAYVTSSEFPTMNWPSKYWGFSANIMPGNTNKDKLRYVIAQVGVESATREVLYTHTGWRKIGGSWCFLHQDGAIGAEGVSVKLEGKLSRYDMKVTDASAADGAELDMALPVVMKPKVAFPLLATCYLAPLTEWMRRAGCAPRYTLFILGRTGTRKTTSSALALSHFGIFTGDDMPASFSDTANSVMRSAFLLKDVPIAVDDYYPTSSLQDRRKMEQMAQTLSRAFGDHADRGRLNSDMSQRAPTPPRGLAIITGEDTPNINQSGVSRYYIVEIDDGDIPADETMLDVQEKAREGCFVAAMRGYIEWILREYIEKDPEAFGEQLRQSFLANRKQAQRLMAGSHARAPESVAYMMVGIEMMLRYFVTLGVTDMDSARDIGQQAWNVAIENSRKQSEEARDEKPSRQFLRIVRELLQSGVNKCLAVDDDGGSINVIGYQDEKYYYLMPEIAYKTVSKFLSDQGQIFAVSRKTLLKQLVEDRIIPAEYISKQKKIRSKNGKYLWIPRGLLDNSGDGGEPTEEKDADVPFT